MSDTAPLLPSSNASTATLPIDETDSTTMGKDGAAQSRRVRDQIGLISILSGLALFLPIVQYLIFHNVSKADWKFGLHPISMSLAITFVFLSILPLQTSTPSTKATSFLTHQLLIGLLAFPLFLLGASMMYWNKASHSAPHFTTWHGTAGVWTVGWIVGQATVGGLAHRLSESVSPRWKWVYKYHRASGYFLLPLILFTAHLGGAYSDWSIGHSTRGLRIAAFDVGLGLVVVGMVLRIRTSKMKFV